MNDINNSSHIRLAFVVPSPNHPSLQQTLLRTLRALCALTAPRTELSETKASEQRWGQKQNTPSRVSRWMLYCVCFLVEQVFLLGMSVADEKIWSLRTQRVWIGSCGKSFAFVRRSIVA